MKNLMEHHDKENIEMEAWFVLFFFIKQLFANFVDVSVDLFIKLKKKDKHLYGFSQKKLRLIGIKWL